MSKDKLNVRRTVVMDNEWLENFYEIQALAYLLSNDLDLPENLKHLSNTYSQAARGKRTLVYFWDTLPTIFQPDERKENERKE